MQAQIVNFISAMRKMGVPVSLAESIEAQNAVQITGAEDKTTFRLSLRSTLVKSRRDQVHFDNLFPLFFSSHPRPPLIDIRTDLNDAQADAIRQVIHQASGDLEELLNRLFQGAELTQEEIDRLGKMAGLQHANSLRYKGWVTRRMEQALRLGEAQQAIMALTEGLVGEGIPRELAEQVVRMLAENRETIAEQLRSFTGSRIAENLADSKPGIDSDLLDKPFASLSEEDMQILRDQVKRLAALLRSRVALRQKRAKSGQLDPKATIRANLRHGGVPAKLVFRSRHIKPKLVVMCDISTSMRYCSELMLSLIYELQDQITRTHAFAFIDRLEFITPDFERQPGMEAVRSILARNPPGYYSTDLGFSLENFSRDYLDTIDSRTSFIIVGDARNNYNDPNLAVFEKIVKRSHRTLWINPESRMQWMVGDSDMVRYAPYCDDILRAGTLNELTSVVDKLLS